MQPGDLVRIRFWDTPMEESGGFLGIILNIKIPSTGYPWQHTNFYNVWLADANIIGEFAIEELQLIQECPCQRKK